MMRLMKWLLAVAGLALASSSWAFTVGSTKEEVIAELGRPTGEGKRGGKEFLYYGGGVVELQGGKVTKADGAVSEFMTKRAQGLVQVDGRWVTPEEKKQIEAAKAEQAKIGPKVQVVANGGKEIALEALLVPGKVTVIDFYADWCGPCRQLSPFLEEMTKTHPDVYLRKVDIVKWGTPVTGQYDIDSVPNVRVYDRRGKKVGSPTHRYDEILKNVDRASR
jgi:thioredoxin 1